MTETQESATHGVTGYESPQGNLYQMNNLASRKATSFSFSIQIRTDEGLSIRGRVNMSTVVPQRASKPVQVVPDIEQEYDDNLSSTPRSAIRFRGTQHKQETSSKEGQTARDTDKLATPVTTKRVSGTTRLLLWVVLILGIAFLINGLIVPAIVSFNNQLHYGDAQIATYDINGSHFITEEDNGRVQIVVSSPDATHNQILVYRSGVSLIMRLSRLVRTG